MKNELNFRHLKNFRGKYAPNPTQPNHTHTTRLAALAWSRALRDPKGDYHGYLSSFRGINIPKSGPFKYKNNAQTLPKQVQNNFEKVQKSTFLTSKLVKNDPSNQPK